MEIFEQILVAKGILFSSLGSNLIPAKLVDSIKVWKLLLNEGTVTAKEVKVLYQNYLPTGSRVNYGFKKPLYAQADDELLNYDQLKTKFGLICDLPWFEALSIETKALAYLRKALETEDLDDIKRIEVTTIHATKGREADNVVVLPNMAWPTWNAFEKNPDTEHRTFYVACTRARKALYLHKPTQDLAYRYPNIL